MLLASLAFFWSVVLSVGVDALTPPPRFTVDLNVAAEKRWSGAVKTVLDTHPWEWSFGAAFSAHNDTLFKNLSDDDFDSLGVALNAAFPENAAELKGIASEFSALGHAVSYNYLAAWVYFHELAHTEKASDEARAQYARSCCAVIARDPATNAILHVGNMDQSPKNVRNVTLHVEFRVGDAVAFEAVDWYVEWKCKFVEC